MFPNLPPKCPVAVDFETTGLDYWNPSFGAFGVAVAVPGHQWYFDMRSTPNARQWLLDLLPGRLLIAHNAQFDLQCARTLGADPRASPWYCTMVNESLIYEHYLKYDLGSVAKRYGIESHKHDLLEKIRAAKGLKTIAEVLKDLGNMPPDLVADYCANDVRETYLIYEKQLPILHEQCLEVVSRLEMALLPVLADMSYGGVRVDLAAAHASIPVLTERVERLQKEINDAAGQPINVNSSKQIRELFKPEALSKFQWRLVDGSIVGPTDGGDNPSIDQVALRSMKHPLAAKILSLRKNTKLRDTFMKGHILGNADAQGYVHSTFNQTRNDSDAGTVTGRLSSTAPALQQITKRDKENGAMLRSMFLPDEGDLWLCADYSQVDFRCAAHLQNAPDVIAAYAANPDLDYHQIVSDMTGIPRNPAYAGAPNTKQMNLGLAFGSGKGKLAWMMGLPYEIKENPFAPGKMMYIAGPEATAVFDLYHKKLPTVQRFIKRAATVAETTGYVQTATGRRLRFPKGVSNHKAASFLYQSYAADLHKYGLVAVDALIREKNYSARLMVSVHDEIGVSMQKDDTIAAEIIKRYTDFMSDTSSIKMRVPITASKSFGNDWWEASSG